MSPKLARGVRPFLASQILTTVGDSCFHITLSVCALDLSGQSGLGVGATWLIRTLPFFMAMPLTGWVVDKVKRRKVMRMADLGRSMILFLLAGLLAAGSLDMPTFWILTFLKSFGDVLFMSARDAWITQLPGAEGRMRVNSIVMGGYNAGFAAGIMMAGALLALGWGPSELVAINALTYALSLWILGRTLDPDLPPSLEPVRILTLRQWRGLFRKYPGLRDILVFAGVNNLLIMGPALVSAPLLIRHTMGLEWKHFAWYEVAVAMGAMLSSWWMFSRRPKHLLAVFFFGIFLDGISFVPFILLDHPGRYLWMLPLGAFHAFMVPILMIARTTWIQDEVPADMQGRVFAAISTMVLGFMGLGCLLTGWALDTGLTTPQSFYAGGILTALTGLAGLFRVRKLDATAGRPG